MKKQNSLDAERIDQIIRINEFMDSLVAYVDPLAREKNLHFRCRTEHMSATECYEDRPALTEIMTELLENAVKYTPEGGDIILCAREVMRDDQNVTLEFYVQDDGIGFEPEVRDRIFFRAAGTGSLADAKKAAEKMLGSLSCESSPGMGSIVRLMLTLPAEDIDHSLPIPDFSREFYSFSGKKVLLVEDHPLNLEIAQMLLERVGFEVITAVNGREAVDIFAAVDGQVDLILMDIRMPVLDGIEATRVIRSMDIPGADRIPIIALTASAYEDDARKSRAAGMSEPVLKPIDPGKLYRILKKYLFANDERNF